MTGRMLAELAWVASHDADGISQPYAWPPRAPMSADEVREVSRLDTLSRRLAYAARAAGCVDQSGDALFGGGR